MGVPVLNPPIVIPNLHDYFWILLKRRVKIDNIGYHNATSPSKFLSY